MVTTRLETKSLGTVAPLHLGVFALKVFCIVPAYPGRWSRERTPRVLPHPSVGFD